MLSDLLFRRGTVLPVVSCICNFGHLAAGRAPWVVAGGLAHLDLHISVALGVILSLTECFASNLVHGTQVCWFRRSKRG